MSATVEEIEQAIRDLRKEVNILYRQYGLHLGIIHSMREEIDELLKENRQLTHTGFIPLVKKMRSEQKSPNRSLSPTDVARVKALEDMVDAWLHDVNVEASH